MNQKRSLVFVVLLIATLLVLSACGGESNKGLDGLVKHFEDNGFTTGEEQEKHAEMIGAEDGFGVELNDSTVEFYQYENDSSDLADIKKNGEYDMEGFVIKAITNGNLVLTSYEDHPDEDKVIEVFNSY